MNDFADTTTPRTRVDEVSRKDVVDTYAFYAPLYDQLFGAVLEPGRRALTAAVREVNPATLLEVGVGTGLTLAGYPHQCRVTGIDISQAMLDRAQARAASLGRSDVQLQVEDAEQMSFPTASFDCVALPYVLSVTPHPARLVREVRRVCKPGGTIVIVNHFSGSGFWWLMERAVKRLAARIGFRSDFSYALEIESHDWTVERVSSVNLFGLSKLVVIRNG